MKLLLCLMIVLSAGLFGGAVYLMFSGSEEKRLLSSRLRQYATAAAGQGDRMEGYVRAMKQALQFVASRVRPLPQAGSLERSLQRAGLPLFVSEFLAIVFAVAIGAALLAWAITGSGANAVLTAVVAGLCGFLYLGHRVSARQKVFHRQLGDTLVMMANALRSGFSFLQAVELVASDMKPPVSEEFGRMMHEVRLGLTTEEALQHLSERVNSADLDLIITAVLIQRQVGGNLAQLFDTISATINDRLRLRTEIGSITAQGQLSGWVLGLMPLGIGLLSYMMNPDSIAPLFETEIGRIAVVAGLISQAIGILFIRKIVNIKI